jgi:membrane-bound metal-dependent hydrolase YbcI (DUF457 family)
MYIGHYAVAFAAKKAAPRTSLGTLIAAAQLIDLIWPVLVLMGVERVAVEPGNTVVTPLNFQHYPYTHSLVAVLGWAALASGLYWILTRYRAGAITIGLAVVSHWVLDLLTHMPDLPLFPGGGPKLGLGLWNSLPGTILLELTLFTVGVLLYIGVTRARNKRGKYALASLVLFLLITYMANLYGPPPPDAKLVAMGALLLWLLVPWGYWIDRNRKRGL